MPTSGLPDAPAQTCPLTPRQLEVIALAADGLTMDQIGSRLYLSVDTVRTHSKDAMRRSGLHSTTGLVALALRQGWIR
jgi:two-component system response regulator DesR